MNTKNNRRRRESVAKIEAAFFSLLKEKELFQIRVAEICKLAGINRSTFYAHYFDVYDLADKLRERLAAEVQEFFLREETLTFKKEDFLTLFEHIRDHQELYRFYFKLQYDRTENLKLYSAGQAGMLGSVDGEILEYHVAFFKNGLNAIVRRWLDRGCAEDPEIMCGILLREYLGRIRKD